MDQPILIAGLFAIAFVCEFIDSSLGMGYGTTLTPLLLILGFSPLVVVPAILSSELVTGLFAAYMHQRAGNVQFDFRNDPDRSITGKMALLGYIPRSRDSRIALVLGSCSLVGAVAAVFLAVTIPVLYVKLIVGAVVLAMGILILIKHRKATRFSWRKIVGLGITAAFNKGLSGGGYGPLVTSGQILSGVETRNSVAITSLAESFTCLVGLVTYFLLGEGIDLKLTVVLMAGAVASVPFAATFVKRISIGRFTLAVGCATVSLGLFTILKLVL